MRLSTIKLAGFKSFVDPTQIDFHSNLTGILGPNGCGKSNTIDAVRWVMGESSAKHLRGQSMEDVIFNGSASRKPVGQASVELVFDNSDHSLGGEYATFSELSIKRLVTREGKSQYFLNSSRCRRRDITDIFLGTGLGPRSYAIIEQGMIARLIESKPAELRVYIEEAAGISKYKERRREAANRIRHTRESLQRLADVQEEISKQLARLKRQANAATHFKTYKATERQLQAELLVLRLQIQSDDIQLHQQQLDQQATQHQALLSQLRHTERQLEEQRVVQETANEHFNQVQGHYYRIGAEISRLEQSIKHQADLLLRQQTAQQQLQVEMDAGLAELEQDRFQLEQLHQTLSVLEPSLETQQIELDIANETLFEADTDRQDWQQQWALLQTQLSEPTQQAQIENHRMRQIELSIQQYQQRLQRLQSEVSAYNLHDLSQQLQDLSQQQQQLQQQKMQLNIRQQEVKIHLQQIQAEYKQQLQQKNTYITQQQTLIGQLASLEVLQHAGLGSDNKKRQQWLLQHHLAQQPHLAQQIQIDPIWEKALETVLAQQLEAIYIDDFQALAITLQKDQALENIGLQLFFEPCESNKPVDQDKISLSSKVQQPHAIKTWLSHIYCVANLTEALVQYTHLQQGESLITPEGIWLGTNWLRINSNATSHQGILARQQEIVTTQQALQTLENSLSLVEATLIESEQQLEQLTSQHSESQQAFNQCHQQYSQVCAAQHAQQATLENTQQRVQYIEVEIVELQENIKQQQITHTQVEQRHQQAVMRMEQLAQEKEDLQVQHDALEASFSNANEQVQWLRDHVQDSRLQIETARTQKQASQTQLQRLEERLLLLQQRQEALLLDAKQHNEPEEALAEALQTELARQHRSESQLSEARNQLESIEQAIKEYEKQRLNLEHDVAKQRDHIEQLKLQWQASKLHETALLEQFAKTQFTQETIIKNLPINASIEQHQQQIQTVKKSMQRLGAINLAAIEEYAEESQRQIYLEQQVTDLESALATLETAMAKIDKETRSRFKDTFEQVSYRINAMFAKLFGGGEAYLAMTDKDLLDTGVMIMAKPPGKKITNIHLLSGGEKALTAVAMIFAIFELNPAPFCMLDEVDAPLDEANVGRFADLVREMSKQVQFIFITHNKATMELAENLVGVTMRESGVSRLVSVDLEEAVRISDAV